ncbi:MAG: xanthine dehydrogenase family protein molybdopterin-binding subunit [Alphaproteobacteria bacterium]
MTEEVAEKTRREPYVGRPMERVEDEALLRGMAHYTDDYAVRNGTLHAAILRSPHAHAEIVSIDTAKALEQPGVFAVITGDDVLKYTDPFLNAVKAPMKLFSLAIDRVRYVGEALALVVADDRYKAEDACEHIDVTYNVLKPVVLPLDAAKDDAILIHPEAESNVMSEREFRYGDPETAFAEADHVIDLTIDFPRSSHTPLEGFVVVAEHLPAEGSYDVLSNFQGPFSVHPVMSRALRVTDTKLRLRTPAISGGGFGIKIAVFPYIVLMCIASRIAGRPVKWVEDRYEHLASATAAPNRIIRMEMAAKKDGRVTAFRFDQLDDYGAHVRAPMPGPLYRMHGVMTGAYDIPNLAIRNRLVMTNKCPSGMVRGFGGPQIYYAMERAMHRVAVELGLDPLDVIRKNLVPSGAHPYHAAAGAWLDSGDYPKALDIAVRDGKLEELKQRRDAARAEGRIYGIGYTAVIEPTQSNMGYLSNILPHAERIKRGEQNGATSISHVNIDPFGGVFVTSDTTPQGQGHATILSQIVADQLGLRMEDITCNLEIDTQKDPWSIGAGSYSCRFSSGPAVATHIAAVAMREKLARIAAPNLNVPVDEVEFADGKIFARDNPENMLSFNRVAGRGHWSPGTLPPEMEAGMTEKGVWSPPELTPPDENDRINTSLTYGFNFDFCGVEIDRDTAEVRIDHYVTIHDAGKILNPLIVEGQLFGSFTHGIGEAIYEEFVYGEDGSFKSGTFADYLVPTAYEVPEPIVLHMESPTPLTPLGAKGVAEGNCMSTPVCLANAVCDALDIEHIDLPLTGPKLAEILEPEEPPPPQGAAVAPAPAPAGDDDHALKGTGSTLVPASPEEVWRTLLDPEALAAVIPGCHKLDVVAENEYHATVSLGVGPVRGRFEADVRLSELDPPNSVTLSGALSGPLGSSRGSGQVRLAASGDGTQVDYNYSVEISGKVAAVGGRLLEGAAGVVVGQFFERLTAQVGGKPAAVSLWARLLRLLGIGR